MIRSIGIELEGAWNDLPEYFFRKDKKHNMQIYRHDGSVHDLTHLVCHECECIKRECGCNNPSFDKPDMEEETFFYVGEVASYPYENINNLIKFVKDYYPIKTNQSCSMHVHLKPNDSNDYLKLMTKKYYRDFLNVMEYWGKSRNINAESELWKRLRGKNTFCLRQFKPLNNMQDSERYSVINYCYNKHGTIEIRLLPAFQSMKLGIDAIKFLYDFTNIWLSNNRYMTNKTIQKNMKLKDVTI